MKMNQKDRKASTEPIPVASLKAIYDRIHNHLKNEQAMGNSLVVVRSIVLYALLEFIADSRKDEHAFQIEDARQHGILEDLGSPEDVPILLEAVNTLHQIFNNYIPSEHTASVMRELLYLSSRLSTSLELSGQPSGPIGFYLQPTLAAFLKPEKDK